MIKQLIRIFQRYSRLVGRIGKSKHRHYKICAISEHEIESKYSDQTWRGKSTALTRGKQPTFITDMQNVITEKKIDPFHSSLLLYLFQDISEIILLLQPRIELFSARIYRFRCRHFANFYRNYQFQGGLASAICFPLCIVTWSLNIQPIRIGTDTWLHVTFVKTSIFGHWIISHFQKSTQEHTPP